MLAGRKSGVLGSTSEESCLPKDDVLEKNRRKRLDE